jgi:hypothetical protein
VFAGVWVGVLDAVECDTSTMPATAPLPHVFIACAPPDIKYAELIMARTRSDQLPLRLAMFGEGRFTDADWQLECRRRITSASAVLVLMSCHTRRSPRALWQMRCARDHGVPVVGLTVMPIDEGPEPGDAPVEAQTLIGWRWKTIVATLMQFSAGPLRATSRAGGPESAFPAPLSATTHGSAA